jgi:ribosome-associated protein
VNLNTSELNRIIIETLEEKMGENIVLIDINEIADFASFFIICNGTSARMLDSLANHVIDTVKSNIHHSPRKEGKPEDGWLVLDVGDVVLHLFTPDQREHYKLEELWSNGKVLLRVQ